MIFVTVGSQLPFDRLIEAIDEAAPRLAQPIFAQIGRSALQPLNIEYTTIMKPAEFDHVMQNAEVIVGHAGIGTVLQARKYGKPLIVVPRRATKREHRNDHQLATARALLGRPDVRVAFDPQELEPILRENDRLISPQEGFRSEEFERLLATLAALTRHRKRVRNRPWFTDSFT